MSSGRRRRQDARRTSECCRSSTVTDKTGGRRRCVIAPAFKLSEQPQRDSNPCRHLERVGSLVPARTPRCGRRARRRGAPRSGRQTSGFLSTSPTGSCDRAGRSAARCTDSARVVRRGEIYWVELGEPAGRRPVCIVTRDAAIDVLTAVTCAPITRAVREIQSELEVGPEEGLSERSVVACDNLVTIPKSTLDRERVGRLGLDQRAALDRALRYSLDIQY
jgi:mRNA interferase MazF